MKARQLVSLFGAALCALTLLHGGPAVGAIFTDNFDTSHDYSGGNVAGTIWDGIRYNEGNISGVTVDANLSSTGELTLASQNGNWEHGANDGLLLYVDVTGDFTTEVQATSTTSGNYNGAGLMARLADPAADGDPGEDWVFLSYSTRFNINRVRNVDNSTTTQPYSPGPPQQFLQMERIGDDLVMRRRASLLHDWTDIGTVNRADLNGLPLQVGLWQANFTTPVQSGTLDNFRLAVGEPLPPLDPPPPLVGLWQFDNAFELGRDSAPGENHLTPQGDAIYDAGGLRGGAASLDGAGDMLDSPGGFPAGVPVGDQQYTMAAWIKPDVDNVRGIVGWGNYGTGNQVNAFRLGTGNQLINYWWGPDLVLDSPINLTDGGWHHVAATFDGTTQTLWVDGNAIGSQVPGGHTVTPTNFAVGRTCIHCGGGEFFDGKMDDVAVLDVGLDRSQLREVIAGEFSSFGGPSAPAGPEVPLVSLWRFDNALALGEDSATGNTLTKQGDAAFDAVGKSGGAVRLDGVGDMLDSPAAFPTDVPTGNQPYTIAAWVKPDHDGATQGIIGWGNYGNAKQVNALRLNGNNTLRHYWWSGDVVGDAGASDLDDGGWHHIAVTFDGVLRSIWVDGVMVEWDVPGVNNAGAANFAIGRTYPGGNEFFAGTLDDVAIFAGALDQIQLEGIMTGDFTEFGIPIPEPSSIVLAATGLVGLLVLRRRRR